MCGKGDECNECTKKFKVIELFKVIVLIVSLITRRVPVSIKNIYGLWDKTSAGEGSNYARGIATNSPGNIIEAIYSVIYGTWDYYTIEYGVSSFCCDNRTCDYNCEDIKDIVYGSCALKYNLNSASTGSTPGVDDITFNNIANNKMKN